MFLIGDYVLDRVTNIKGSVSEPFISFEAMLDGFEISEDELKIFDLVFTDKEKKSDYFYEIYFDDNETTISCDNRLNLIKRPSLRKMYD